ncbi:hypothetical protein VTP01DRAFT_9473 [Rhizomucor pusillus]
MMNRSGRGYLYLGARGEILGLPEDKQLRKHLSQDISIDQGRRLDPLDKLGILAKVKFLGSGGSMDASLKLKGIDGRAPPGVEPAA